MPYILIDGYDAAKVMREVTTTVHVDFREDYFNCNRLEANSMVKSLEEELVEVIKKYYDKLDRKIVTDKEYKFKMW